MTSNNKEQFHRQLFNGITIVSGLLMMATLEPSQSDFMEYIIMLAFIGGIISFIYGWVLVFIRFKTKGETREYNTLLSSRWVTGIALMFYLVELGVFIFFGMLLLLGPGPMPSY